MDRKFIQITSGWIPVFVLVLLAAALVSGGLPGTPVADTDPTDGPLASLHVEIRETLKDAESVRQLVDSLAYVPARIERVIDASMPSADAAPDGPISVLEFDNE